MIRMQADPTGKAEKVYIPPPPLPKTPIDPSLGTETNVVTADRGPSESSAPTPSSATLAAEAAHATWLSSLLDAGGDALPAAHPFAAASSSADIRQMPPSRRVEEWRFTDLRTLFASRFEKPVADATAVDAARHIAEGACAALVFINGVFSADKSCFDDDTHADLVAAGGFVGSLADFPGDAAGIAEMFAREDLDGSTTLKGANGLFPALNTALARDAAIVDVPAEFAVSKPIVFLFAASGGDEASQTHPSAPRLAIRTGTGSSVSVVESHLSLDPNAHSLVLSSAVVHAGDNSTVRHSLANSISPNAHIVASVSTNVHANASYHLLSLHVGGQMSRVSATVELVGNGSHGEVLGASVTNQKRVSDLHSRIVHRAKHTTSNQLQKNIATDRGRTVFSGKIIVTPEGDFSDSSQLCRSLLLSEKAQVDAMPVLEIATDEVKASHGATVSDLEPDEIFYCQSRGLTADQARTLLITGFVKEVLKDSAMKYLAEIVDPIIERVARDYKEGKQRRRNHGSI